MDGLGSLKLGELKQRAQAVGVAASQLDAAIDEADDPKAAGMSLNPPRRSTAGL